MPFAILQIDLAPLTLEQLQRAFRYVPGLTAADAHILGRDAFGILVKNFTSEQAASMQGALRLEGIETEIVDQSHLPTLPVAKQINRMDCLPEHLAIFDPLGRSFSLPWEHVAMIAGGPVRLTEFVRTRQERQVIRYNMGGEPYADSEVDYNSREQRNLRLVADVVITGGGLRYSITADEFNFVSLGVRKTPNAAENLVTLLQDLRQFAQRAVFAHGAELLCNNQYREYPSKNAYVEEMTWTLWQMKKRSV